VSDFFPLPSRSPLRWRRFGFFLYPNISQGTNPPPKSLRLYSPASLSPQFCLRCIARRMLWSIVTSSRLWASSQLRKAALGVFVYLVKWRVPSTEELIAFSPRRVNLMVTLVLPCHFLLILQSVDGFHLFCPQRPSELSTTYLSD